MNERSKAMAMKRLVRQFDIINSDGTVVDSFTWYADSNNHHNISNKSGCLYDGYEGHTEWEKIRRDMNIVKIIGNQIVDVK